MKIRVILSGRHYDAAQGVPESLDLPEGCSLADALRTLSGLLPPERPLAPSCLVAVSGAHQGTVAACRERTLQDGDELVVIAPVAGG